jgi:hypothetical protein
MLARPKTIKSLEARRLALTERSVNAHRKSMAVLAPSDRLKKESQRIRAARPRRKK